MISSWQPDGRAIFRVQGSAWCLGIIASHFHYVFEGLREVFPRQRLVDFQHRLIGGGVEAAFGRKNFPSKQARQTLAVEIAALERFRAEMMPECMQESRIGQGYGLVTAEMTRPLADHRDLGVGPANGELPLRPGQPGWKTAMFGHFGDFGHAVFLTSLMSWSKRLALSPCQTQRNRVVFFPVRRHLLVASARSATLGDDLPINSAIGIFAKAKSFEGSGQPNSGSSEFA